MDEMGKKSRLFAKKKILYNKWFSEVNYWFVDKLG
jgi:hypothetical protein